MAHDVKISKHGLGRCPSCRTHLKLAAHQEETACPFCGATLRVSGAAPSGLLSATRGLLSSGRSGLLAASLLGMTVVGGCGAEEEEPPNDTSNSDASDATTSSSGGEDTAPVALYGIPPSDMMEGDTSAPPNDVPSAMYGLPADTTSGDTEDIGAQPAYGIAPEPEPDAGP